MPRGAAVVYPKDAAQIVAMADIFPGAHVVEAGVGSGALTCSLLRAVGPHGRVSSYERREEFADVARAQRHPVLRRRRTRPGAHLGDLAEALPASGERADRVILDMLAPWECVDAAADALRPGRHRLRVRRHHDPAVPLRRDACALHGGFTEPQAWESLVRDWHVEGLAVRPGHKMIGHTGVPGHRPPDGAGRAAAAEEAPPGARAPTAPTTPARARPAYRDGAAPTRADGTADVRPIRGDRPSQIVTKRAADSARATATVRRVGSKHRRWDA